QHLPLLPGQYYLGIALHCDRGVGDSIREAVDFEVNPSPQSAEINAEIFGGALTASALISPLERADIERRTQADRSENKFDTLRFALGPHRESPPLWACAGVALREKSLRLSHEFQVETIWTRQKIFCAALEPACKRRPKKRLPEPSSMTRDFRLGR